MKTQMHYAVRFFAMLAACLSLAPATQAATTTYTFSASVAFEVRGGQLATPAQSLFTPGAAIAGSFDFDNGVPGIPNPAGAGMVYGAVSNLLGSIEGNLFSDPEGGVLVLNNGLDLDPNSTDDMPVDLLVVAAEDGLTANLNGFSLMNGPDVFTLVNVRLFWFDTALDFLDDESLPADLAPATEFARVALDFFDFSSGMTHSVFAEPLVLTAAPVPLPAALWLMLSALGLLGVNRSL